jgi:hypothetical protein
MAGPGKPTWMSRPLAKAMSILRGDKYMVGAYPPQWHGDAAARDSATVRRSSHDDAAET